MLKNYLLVACRNLWRHKALSLINIFGLGVALMVCLLIFLFTRDELSFDQFHTNKLELYQLTCKIKENGEAKTYGLGGVPQGPAFKEAIPEIKSYVRIADRECTVKKGNEVFEESVLWADSNFFSVFSFPLLAGNAAHVLDNPNSMVISDDMAEKYFGTQHVLGKILELETGKGLEPFVITGVARRAPQNSSIRFKLIVPFANRLKFDWNGWFMLSYPTFFVMPANVNVAAVSAKMQKIFSTSPAVAEEKAKGVDIDFTWGLQPFLNMHLNTHVEASPQQSNPIYSYLLSAIAIFILAIACINFVNLTIAQSMHRSREIGIRKVVGGRRQQLITQFIGESFVVCAIAFVLAFVLTAICLPAFNVVAGKELSLTYLPYGPLLAGFAGLFVFTVLAAGIYPALVMSKADPVQSLYQRQRFTGKNYLSRGLIVLQFTLATFLVTGTLFVYYQFDYFLKKDLGYNPNNLMTITTSDGRNRHLAQVFRNELAALPGVQQVAPCMSGTWFTNTKANGHEFDVKYEHVDSAYFTTLQVPFLHGRNFSADFPADSTQSVIINEAYAKAAGWRGSPIGKTVNYLNGADQKLTVIGVIRDYHFESLHEKIKPQIFSLNSELPFGRFIMRLAPGSSAKTLAAAEKVCHKLQPYHPFTYEFVSDSNQKQYADEARWKSIITFAAGFATFISCIGLFGLTMLSVQKRVKEIGIRKVLGASVLQISTLVSENFIVLVLIAFVVAVPAAWFAVNQWLQNFAYHIAIKWYMFGAALLLVMLVALITVAINTIKAALANPVKNLRTE